MKKTLSIAAVSLLVVFTACGKYEEGPGFSLRSKTARVANEWKVEFAYDQDEQKEVTVDFAGETWEFTKDGVFFERENGELDDTGNWEFINDKEEIVISFPSDTERFTILKLKENEMWLQDGDEELHLVPAE